MVELLCNIFITICLQDIGYPYIFIWFHGYRSLFVWNLNIPIWNFSISRDWSTPYSLHIRVPFLSKYVIEINLTISMCFYTRVSHLIKIWRKNIHYFSSYSHFYQLSIFSCVTFLSISSLSTTWTSYVNISWPIYQNIAGPSEIWRWMFPLWNKYHCQASCLIINGLTGKNVTVV